MGCVIWKGVAVVERTITGQATRVATKRIRDWIAGAAAAIFESALGIVNLTRHVLIQVGGIGDSAVVGVGKRGKSAISLCGGYVLYFPSGGESLHESEGCGRIQRIACGVGRAHR